MRSFWPHITGGTLVLLIFDLVLQAESREQAKTTRLGKMDYLSE